MAVNETVNIRYVLSYIDQGIRRVLADDQQVRDSARATGAEMGGAAERASVIVRDSFRAQRASAVELAQGYGVAASAAREQALAARSTAAQAVVALAQERRGAAALAAEYLALAQTETATMEERAAAQALYERSAVQAGIAVVQSNERIAASHLAAGAAATKHSREERGFLAGTGLLGGRSLVFASTAFLGAAELGKITRDIVQTTTEMQTAQAQVRVALANTGQSWATQGTQIEAYIEHMGRATGFLRGPLLAALATFIRVNKGDVPQAMKDLTAATELARGKNIDLAAAAGIVTRAQIGMVTILRRQGIDIKAVTTAQDALRDSHAKVTAEVRAQAKAYDMQQTGLHGVDALLQQFGGNAARYMHTAAGATANYHRAIEDLDVELGRVLIPELTRGITHLTTWVDHLHDSGQAGRDMRDVLGFINAGLAVGVPLLRTSWQFINLLAHAMGGWNRVIQVYIGYRFARFILTQVTALGELSGAQVLARVTGTSMATQAVATTGAIEAEGVAAQTTAGRLTLLRTGLLRLGALGGVALAVDLIVNKQDRHSFFNEAFGRQGSIVHGIDSALLSPFGANAQRYGLLGQYIPAGARGFFGMPAAPVTPGVSVRGFDTEPFGARGQFGLLQGVGGQRRATTLYDAYSRALLGARDSLTQQVLTPPGLLAHRVVGGARRATVEALLQQFSTQVGFMRTNALQQLLTIRVRALPVAQRGPTVQAMLDRFAADVRAGRDTTAERLLAPQLVQVLPTEQRAAAMRQLQAAYVARALASRTDIDGKVWASRLAELPQGIRAAVEAALRTQTAKRNKLTLTALTKQLDTVGNQIDQVAQAAEARLSVRGLDQQAQGYFTAEEAIQQGTVDRLRALQVRLQAALQEARTKGGRGSQAAQHVSQQLQDTQTKIEQAVAAQADLARQAVTAAVDRAVQLAGEATGRITARASERVQLQGLDTSSPQALRLEGQAQGAVVARLQRLRTQLTGRLAGAQPAVARHIHDQLVSTQDQIDAAVAQQADLAHQAVTSAVDLAQTRATTRLQNIQSRVQRVLLRRGLAADSPQGLQLEAQAERQSLVVMRGLQGNLRTQLAGTRAPAVRTHIQQLLNDIATQIGQATAQLADEARQQVLQGRQRVVDRATNRLGLQQTLYQRLQIREGLAGIAGTPAAGAEQAAFIRQSLIPATQAQLGALQRQLRTAERQHRPADEVAGIRSQVEQARNQLLQEQLDALDAIKANTAQTVATLQGGLGLEFQSQTFTDQLLQSGVGL